MAKELICPGCDKVFTTEVAYQGHLEAEIGRLKAALSVNAAMWIDLKGFLQITKASGQRERAVTALLKMEAIEEQAHGKEVGRCKLHC